MRLFYISDYLTSADVWFLCWYLISLLMLCLLLFFTDNICWLFCIVSLFSYSLSLFLSLQWSLSFCSIWWRTLSIYFRYALKCLNSLLFWKQRISERHINCERRNEQWVIFWQQNNVSLFCLFLLLLRTLYWLKR